MKLRRLYTLLIVWGIFLMLPGLLMELGVFGRIDTNSSSGGLILRTLESAQESHREV